MITSWLIWFSVSLSVGNLWSPKSRLDAYVYVWLYITFVIYICAAEVEVTRGRSIIGNVPENWRKAVSRQLIADGKKHFFCKNELIHAMWTRRQYARITFELNNLCSFSMQQGATTFRFSYELFGSGWKNYSWEKKKNTVFLSSICFKNNMWEALDIAVYCWGLWFQRTALEDQ